MASDSSVTPDMKEKMPIKGHLMCGWPIILVLIGGAIGGVMGFAAYSLNVAIYKSSMSRTAKITQNLLAGLGAFVVWFVCAIVFTGLGSGV
jgi:uncharacterized membrane-anchored protein